jgi:hypothetical protein
MDGTTQDPTVPKTKGRLVVERVFIMLVGLSMGHPACSRGELGD